ncbi:MAG: hypothetical protein ACRD0K_01965 [Egibacteraceae bacterium]
MSSAQVDLDARRLRLSRRHLGLMARICKSQPRAGDDAIAAELAAAGVVGSDGQVVPSLRPVALAAAHVVFEFDIGRARGGRTWSVQAWWSPAGLLVVPQGPDDAVKDIAFLHPSALARTLVRLLGLRARPCPSRIGPGPLTLTELLDPFREGKLGWLDAITDHPSRTTLDRVDVRTAVTGQPATLLLVDSPDGLWRVTSVDRGAFRLDSTTLTLVFAIFATWQRSAMGQGRGVKDATNSS